MLASTVMEAAIKLSLKYLESKLEKLTIVSPKYSMYDMYICLCVLKKQQWMPVSILARMWGVGGKSAERIAILLSSMSLAKTSVKEGKKEIGLTIHYLQLDF